MTFRRHLPRLTLGPVLLGSSLTMGCAFYGVDYDECLDGEDPACLANGDGDVVLGDGDGDVAPGDGDGAGGTGDGDFGGSGGRVVDPPSGGSGGEPMGGTGGAPSGGAPSGGAPSGGAPSGGAPSGGTGGTATGGGGGVTVVDLLKRDLFINEIKWGGSAFVEIYNDGDTDIDATPLYVYGDVADTGNICQLSGVVPANGYLVVQQSSGACLAAPCVAGCSLDLSGGETVGLYYAETPSSTLQKIDEQYLISSFDLGHSYQAEVDGSSKFIANYATVGATNNP